MSEWLDTAHEAGISIIYSSALVRSHYNVTVDDANEISLDQIRSVLRRFNLDLHPAGSSAWVVVRADVPVPEPPSTDVASPGPDVRPNLEEVVVTSSRYRLLVDQSTSLVTMEHDEIARRPAIANDAIRAVNQLPGNASIGVSVKPRVRGGNEDETLILFDDVRLYEPFHLSAFSSLFSTIDSRIIDTVDFYSGGFPARYGDRLSGVMSIQPRSPDQLGSIHELGVGLYNASYLQSGAGRKDQYVLAVRRSALELLGRLAESDFGKPAFSDLYARYDHDLPQGDRLSTNLLWYGDKVSLNNSDRTERASTIDGSAYFWMTFERDRDNHYSKTRLAINTVNKSRKGIVARPDIASGILEDDRELRVYNIAHEIDRFISRSLLFQAGLDYRYLTSELETERQLDFDPAFATLSNLDTPASTSARKDDTGQQISLYSSFRWTLSDRLTAETGLRVDTQDYIASGWSRQISPRLSLMYEFDTGTALRLTWGKFAQSQGIHELQLPDGVDEFHRVEKSIHQIVSLRQQLGSLNIRLEIYRKRGVDDAIYFENLTNRLTLVPELQFDRISIDPDHFEARGAELSLNGNHSDVSWWINYTWSSADDYLGQRRIKRSWDQTHSANAGMSLDLGSWQLAVTGAYHTGWPTTSLFVNNDGFLESGPRNGIRFDHYMSWDFKLIREWQGTGLRLEAGITNLLNRDNQVGVSWAFENGELIAGKEYALGIAPFLDLYWQFR